MDAAWDAAWDDWLPGSIPDLGVGGRHPAYPHLFACVMQEDGRFTVQVNVARSPRRGYRDLWTCRRVVYCSYKTLKLSGVRFVGALSIWRMSPWCTIAV